MNIKDVALHFYEKTNIKITPSDMAKTIKQVKLTVNKGYNTKDIISVINYIIDEKNIKIYSMGYILKCIDNIYEEMKQKEKEREELKKLKEMESNTRRGETSGGNQRKIQRHNSTWFGKVDFSDLFEESRETD